MKPVNIVLRESAVLPSCNINANKVSNKKMKVTAITVCVNYADFLAWAALANRQLFDRWLVCTTEEDHRTQEICSFYGMETVICDFEDDGHFNKFKGINKALEKVKKHSWTLFLDADIVLPPITKRTLEELKLDTNCLYGCDRINMYSVDELARYIDNPSSLIQDSWLMKLDHFKVGSRISQYYGGVNEGGAFAGWSPLGFFQLAHTSSFFEYPYECQDYEHCDMVFAKHWKRENRVMIPEIIGIHLSSSTGWGENWNGRTTPNFLEKKGT